MPWQRWWYETRKNKVYAEVDSNGSLLEKNNKVSIKFKLDDTRLYTVPANSLKPLGEEPINEKLEDLEAYVTSNATPNIESNTEAKAESNIEQNIEQKKAGLKKSPKTKKTTEKIISNTNNNSNKNPIIIYTDGSCFGNPGPCAIGIVMMSGVHKKEYSEYLGYGTNNLAELTAIYRALEFVKDPKRTVILHVDSEYSIGVLSTWKAKANKELIQAIKREMGRFSDLRWQKVPAHSGVVENERCDQLAKLAIESALNTDSKTSNIEQKKL